MAKVRITQTRSPIGENPRNRRRMAKIRITQTRSPIGENQRNRGTLRALGLRKIGQTVEHDEGPVLAGMLRKVRHLVRVENG